MKRVVVLLTLFACSMSAVAGSLTTRDGKTYSGPMQIRGAEVVVTTDGGEKSVTFEQIARADFKTGGVTPPQPGHGLRGEYFAGRSLARLLLTRVDPALDYTWTDALPHPSLTPVGREFSVRWTGRLQADRSEKYTLIANADDGVRVWLDGKPVIDQWHDSAGGDVSAEVALEKDRKYDLKVEYYNGAMGGIATLSWSSPNTPREVIPSENLYLPADAGAAATTQAVRVETPSTDGGPAFTRILAPDRSGLKGEYFADRELEHLNFVRIDPNVDFHFHPDNPPDPSMSPEGSIRWTGALTPPRTEEYRFHVEVNRRARLWVDDKLVIDQWRGEGGEYSSERIPLTAGKRVAFKLEYTSPNGFMLCRLRWSSKSQGRDTVPAEAFSLADDERLSRAVIGMVYPPADLFVAAPSSIELQAAAITPNGSIRQVKFFDRNAPLGDMEQPPFRFTWKEPPPGVYKLRARVTDTAGVTALSESVGLTVTGKGDGSIKAPWGDFYVANNDFKTPGVTSQEGPSTFKIANASGTLVSESEHDAAQLIIQPLLGDGQIVARVTGVQPGPDDGVSGAMAGVTIRESLKNRCKQYSLLYGQPAEEPLVSFVRRQDHWMNPTVTDRPSRTPQGEWFKLARYGQRIYAYTSGDGKEWDLLASERFEAGPQTFVGLVAFGREKAATATFDHVQLIPGAPPLESSVKGFLTRGGTFVAADVFEIDQNLVRYNRGGQTATIPLGEVSRILYKPLLSDHAAKLSPGRTGVLTTDGDFLEGDVRTLKEGSVAVSSVLFGLRKVSVGEEVTAVVLRDVAPERAKYVLTTTDGSAYRAKGIAAAARGLEVEDASLGKVSVPAGTVAALRGE